MRAVKNNKEYSIDESQKKAYQDAGFDIYDEDGELVAFGQGKTVPYEVYQQAKAEADMLLRENKGLSMENEELRAEMEQMLAAENLLNQKEEMKPSESVSEEAAEKKESRKKEEKGSR